MAINDRRAIAAFTDQLEVSPMLTNRHVGREATSRTVYQSSTAPCSAAELTRGPP